MRKAGKIATTIAAVLATTGATAWLGDSIMAARTEQAISQQVRQQARLEITPDVSIQGFPYSLVHFTGELNELRVGISDVTVPIYGMVRTNTVLQDVGVTDEQLSTGRIDGSTAALISRNVGLDAVSIGSLMDITDLDISNPYDISPAAANASEAQLRGTPAGFDEPVAVEATLRLVGPTFKLTPTKLIDGDPAREQEIFSGFELEFNTNTLPMGAQASYVFLSGGTVFFQAQERNVTVHLSDLSPIVSPATADEVKTEMDES